MPYSLNDRPERIKKLPEKAQKIWIAAFNASYSKGEESANKIAWGAIKNAGYKQDKQGNWRRWE
jgi:cation transport regulator ChaB